MKTRSIVFDGILASLMLVIPAAAQSARVSDVRAGVTCHDPCDDPFQLKAWVQGSNVRGLTVTFAVKGRTYRARCSDSGYAHYHLRVRPSLFPQGVAVNVTASVRHGGTTRSASTWFRPNYQ